MARHFKELIVWQRADALRQAVWSVVVGVPAMDLRFRAQWTDATRSVCSNIAEGFGRRTHREFARYLEIAGSSLREAEDLTHEALMRGHLNRAMAAELDRLVRRTAAPLGRLISYLRRTPDARS